MFRFSCLTSRLSCLIGRVVILNFVSFFSTDFASNISIESFLFLDIFGSNSLCFRIDFDEHS